MMPPPPTSTLFPYTTLFRSKGMPLLGTPPTATTTLPVVAPFGTDTTIDVRSEEHTSELQSLRHLVCRLLLEKKKTLVKCTVGLGDALRVNHVATLQCVPPGR